MIRFLSVCSGLEGASLAVELLGWVPVGFSEIEAFPSAIIAERYGSNVPGERLSGNAPPNFGDFTKISLNELGAVDILIGGTPCQAFSVAGKRLSLADARGNLTLAYVVLAHELARSHGLRNCIWENVPGVLSTKDNAFGCFLGALVGRNAPIEPAARPAAGRSNAFWRWREAGNGTDDDGNEISWEAGHITRWPNVGMVARGRFRAAWRVLDAQYFGLAQRRERVFVVADFGNGADPAAVLFEPASLQGNPAPRRETGQRPAGTLSARTEGGGGLGTDFDLDGGLVAFGGGNRSGPVAQAATLTAKGQRCDFEVETFIAGRIAPPIASNPYGDHESREGLLIAHTLRAEGFDASEDGTGRGTPIVPVQCFDARQSDVIQYGDRAGPIDTHGHSQAVAFDLRGRAGGAMPEGPHDTANLRAASGGSSRSYVAAFETHPTLVSNPGEPMSQDWRMHAAALSSIGGGWAVRRLTPRECERLQGVPDDYTRIPWRGKPASECLDGPRYKALGNSWAVPVVAWIAKRIAASLEAA